MTKNTQGTATPASSTTTPILPISQDTTLPDHVRAASERIELLVSDISTMLKGLNRVLQQNEGLAYLLQDKPSLRPLHAHVETITNTLHMELTELDHHVCEISATLNNGRSSLKPVVPTVRVQDMGGAA